MSERYNKTEQQTKKSQFEYVSLFGFSSSHGFMESVCCCCRCVAPSIQRRYLPVPIECMSGNTRDAQILNCISFSYFEHVVRLYYRRSFCNRCHCLRANLRDMCSFLRLCERAMYVCVCPCVCFKHFRLFQFFCVLLLNKTDFSFHPFHSFSRYISLSLLFSFNLLFLFIINDCERVLHSFSDSFSWCVCVCVFVYKFCRNQSLIICIWLTNAEKYQQKMKEQK